MIETLALYKRAGNKDVGAGRHAVRRLLVAAPRVHPRHRLQPGVDQLRNDRPEGVLHRRLLLRPLARHVQQLRQSDHLRLPQRFLQGRPLNIISGSLSSFLGSLGYFDYFLLLCRFCL